jgi:adenosylcobinamide kinase/adenosylcobinamide-phosphate guanylyltransferase
MAIAVVGGGRRCGKSRYALALASAHGPRLGFIATLCPEDEESRRKVDEARRERGPSFLTIEEQFDVPGALAARAALLDAIVVDDLTTWVSNLVLAGRTDAEVEEAAGLLIHTALRGPAEVFLVTCDVDFGFAIDPPSSRQFRRLAGLINRRAAESASRLYWMVFGVPNRIR